MNVEGGIFTHPKYKFLVADVGQYALESLLRLWNHCAEARKGELWTGADRRYVEVVAAWAGKPGVLYRALLRWHWIVEEPGAIRINGWEEHNWRRVVNWNLGNRPKKPRLESPEAKAKPRLVTQGSQTDDYAKPSELTELTELTEYSKREREREMGGASGEEGTQPEPPPDPNGHSTRSSPPLTAEAAQQLRTAAGILLSEIRDLERHRSELDDRERADLRKKRAELKRIQAAQLGAVAA